MLPEKTNNRERSWRSERLTSYSAMAGTLVLLSAGAAGQVMYTDVDPDETYSANGDQYELDLNVDGIVDFVFEIFDGVYSGIITSLNSGSYDGIFQFVFAEPVNGSIAGTSGGSGGHIYAFPYVLSAGALISEGLPWQSNSQQSMIGFIGALSYPEPGNTFTILEQGAWAGQNDKYLGLILHYGGLDYYGWARLDVDENHHQFTIKEYAVQQTADVSITAGQTTAVYQVIQNNELSAYSFGNNITINVNDLHTAGAIVKVFNSNGQMIYQDGLNLNGMTIAMNNAPTGNYTLQVITKENAVFSKQLFIQN